MGIEWGNPRPRRPRRSWCDRLVTWILDRDRNAENDRLRMLRSLERLREEGKVIE